MKKANLYYIILFVLTACGEKKTGTVGDTMTTGKSEIFVEDAFKPIIEEQLEVFNALNPKAELVAKYGNENEIVSNLLKTGSKTIIISRELNSEEKTILKNKSFTPQMTRFAIDAVALITNTTVTDTAITIEQLKNMLSGKNTSKNIVLDNPNSGTVRFLKGFSGSDLREKNIYALKSNTEVIKFVGENKNCIGVIDFNWLNESNSNNIASLKKVKMLAVQGVTDKGFFKPSQTTLALKQYPLSTGIYIIDASGRLGLGAGFASFLIGERGQRILLKSDLLPEQIPSREIRIKN